MSNRLYDILNKIQRWLPALGAFYIAIASIWVLPLADEINKTIAAIATLLAATLEIFSARFYQDNELIIASKKDNITECAEIDTEGTE
jgi:hypothetical protein